MSDERSPSDIAADYLAGKKAIEDLEARQDALRAELSMRLSAHTINQPTVWPLGKAKATWVKGQERSTLSRAKLVLQGVTEEVLDKATVKTVGKPTIRIEAVDEDKRSDPA